MLESNRPASANLVMEEFCSYEFTRSNSEAASSLTAENSRDISHPSSNARPDKCVAWTEEKHNNYLDSLEASFVQQLNQSRRFIAWCTEKTRSGKNSSHRLPVSVSKASEQFTVLQDGHWQKIIFEKDQRLSYISTIKIPEMHCKRRAGKDLSHVSTDLKECKEFHCEEEHLEGKRAFSSGSASSSELNHINNPCYCNSVVKEGSGQNFADEDCENERNAICLAKRLKTAVDNDTSSEDQVIPGYSFLAALTYCITGIIGISTLLMHAYFRLCHQGSSVHRKVNHQ